MIFIDEAHLIFNNASKALLNLLDTMVKLTRSKGVNLIFCTQTPNDIPDSVLAQLGLGERGIRTLGADKGTTVFETAPFGRSGISPNRYPLIIPQY